MDIGEDELLFQHEVIDDTHNPPKLRLSTYLGTELPIKLAAQYPEGQVSVLGKVSKEVTVRVRYKNGVTEMRDERNSPLRNLVLPETVELVEKGALKDCRNLLMANFSACNQVKMESEVFAYCSSLRLALLPEHLTTIPEGTFHCCYDLCRVSFSENITSIEKDAFVCCKNLKLLKGIPSTVTHLGEKAFCGCEALEEISIPLGVTKLPYGLFQDCSNLKTVNLHSGITEIGKDCFFDCKNLQQIQLPEGLQSIGQGAFKGCEKLNQLEIPKSVVTIDKEAFPLGVVEENLQYVHHIATDFFKENSVSYAISWIKGLEDLDELQRESLCEQFRKSPRLVVDVMLVADDLLNEIVINHRLLGYNEAGLLCEAYKENYEFASIFVDYRSRLEELGFDEEGDPFADMTLFELSLSFDYKIKNSGLILGKYHGKESHIFVPDMVEDLPVIEVGFLGENDYVKSISFAQGITCLGDGVCMKFWGLEEVILPVNLECIGHSAFYSCKLQHIDLPETCTDIGDVAFGVCKKLQSISIPKAVAKIRARVFDGCNELKQVKLSRNTVLEEGTFPPDCEISYWEDDI